ncbi:hypothetical protein M0804_014868 [Polistes exclamans]|nr:hypothetical protein M0804_014868 [Polistes exclamans]
MAGTNPEIKPCRRETYTTAVLGGGRTGHPPSSAYDCHESRVGDPALALDNTSGSCSRVGNLARESTDTTGSRGRSVEEGRKCAIRSIEDLGTDTIPVRTHKRARPILYSSSSEDEVIDLTNIDKVLQEKPLVSNLETGRLIDKIIENIAEAEVKRKTCGNIKGEISGKMKSCHLGVIEMARELQARNRVDCGSDIQESLQQLRAEAKATNNRLKQLEEECVRLRRQIKRKDAIIEKMSRGEVKNVPVKVAANQVRSFAEERLVAARKEEEFDNKMMGKVLTELSRSVIQIRQELRDIKTGQGSYAQVAARPRVGPSPPMTTPLTTVPDGDGFIEVRRKNKTATPAGGPLPTRDVRKDDPPGRLRVGGGGPSAGPQQNKKKKKKKKKTRRIRETAAVSLTCAEGASYLEALKKLETGVNLGEIGAKGLSYKRGLRGSFIWQVRGKDANVRADRLAQAMKGALPEAKIARTQRTSPIKLVGIYPTTTLTAIRCGLQEVRAGFDPNLISMGEANLNHARRAQDLLGQRMREIGADIAIVSEPWWVPPRDEKWFSSLGGSPLSAIIAGKGERTCSLVRRGLFFVAVKWGDSLVVSVYFPPSENLNNFSRLLDELEELLGTFPAIPALVAGDFNARFPRRDPESRSNPRGELLCMWANRLNLSLANQVGHPTCVRPQGSSVVDLTWGSLAASVRLTDWKVDEAESLSDHLYVIFKYMHEAAGFRSLRSRNEIFPKWDARAVEEDRLAAALVSGEWIRDDSDNVRDLVRWVNNTLLTSCDMSMSRVRTTADRGRVVPWWSREIALLRGAATTARRRYLRARRGGDPVRIRECLEDRREKRKNLVRAIRRAKASAWRDFIATIEDDPRGRPYRLVMGKLRARGVPLTEALDPHLLERIVATLFPEGGRSIAPNDEVGDAEEIVVTIGEVHKVAKRINLGRAPGPDGIPGLVVKRAATHCGRGLAECFTMLLRSGVFPRVWKRARLVLLKKKHDGDGSAPSAYRPICLLDEVGKLFERVVVSRVSEFLDCGNILSPCQHGFRVGHSTLGAIEEVKDYIQECASDGRVGVLTLLDISNAFNSLPYETVIESMVGSGFPTYLGLGLKVALQKTEATAFPASALRRRRIAPPPVIRYRGVCIVVKPSVKYLGIVLDSSMSFRPHFRALIPKAEGILRSIGRILPNLHGPREKKRRLYSSVIHSVLLYGAPVWWRAVVEDQRIRRAVRALQRRVAIRVCCAYRTVSFHAAMMVAGVIPLDHLAPRLAEVYVTLRNAEGSVSPDIRAALGAFARMGAITAWKEEEIGLIGVIGETGVRVRAAIAGRLDEWVERPYSIGTTFHTTQLMTGHGCFPAYLYGIRRTDSPRCFHCGADRDDAEHTLIECPAWTNARDSLVRELGGGGAAYPSWDSQVVPGYPGGVGCIPVLFRTCDEGQRRRGERERANVSQ